MSWFSARSPLRVIQAHAAEYTPRISSRDELRDRERLSLLSGLRSSGRSARGGGELFIAKLALDEEDAGAVVVDACAGVLGGA